MEKSSNGMIFNIESIQKIFCDFGYKLKVEMLPDIAFHMKQKWNGVENPIRRENPGFNFSFPNDDKYHPTKGFSIIQSDSVFANGILYEEEGRKFYFYFIGSDISKIYRDDDLYQLFKDCSRDIISRFSKSEIRDFNLSLLGI